MISLWKIGDIFKMDDIPDNGTKEYSFWKGLRQNLAVIVAFVSFAAAAGGWYATYSVLTYQVHENKKEILDNTRMLSNHIATTSVHVDPVRDNQLRQEILDRLGRIERKVDSIR